MYKPCCCRTLHQPLLLLLLLLLLLTPLPLHKLLLADSPTVGQMGPVDATSSCTQPSAW
jgi:hypothetical protein